MRWRDSAPVLLMIASVLVACGGPGTRGPVNEIPAEPEAVKAELLEGVQTARVAVTDMGYRPGRIVLAAEVPARLTFSQETRSECGSQVKSAELGIPLTDLPYGEETTVEFTPARAGEYAFVCGMDMMRGAIVVTAG